MEVESKLLLKNREKIRNQNKNQIKTETERFMFHERNYSENENFECLREFNPISKESYEFMTETWKNVY
jgi:hypothetical protein